MAASRQANPPHVDAIVVGSGFGGAVTAARLAQAGLSVTIVERGRRWLPGQFPRDPAKLDTWLWNTDDGLYDVRWLDSMLAIQGAGWGGGSLVYANVFARPAAESLNGRWPEALRRDALDPYYDLAGTMLEVRPVREDPSTGRIPERTRVFEDLVERMDIGSATVRPNLAVRFGPPETWSQNTHGVEQRGCAFVGECILGCNRSAKNSLDHNYLAVAEANSATAVTEANVTRIEQDEKGWAVWTEEQEHGRKRGVRRTATQLFLAAGAVATTELLLRARDVDRTLPDLSETLGQGFSGNGDFLATGNLRRGSGDLTTGPTITTTTVLDVWERSKPVWFQVQDGAIPQPVSTAVDEELPLKVARRLWRRLRSHDRTRTLAFLSMGHDAGQGRLQLDKKGEATLAWANRWQSRLYRAEGRVGPAIARHLGSAVRSLPLWSLFRRAVTVHPLGGVPTGVDRSTGVIGKDNQVHGYPGLYVMDGSVIPASTGANPSATILAAAERTIERIIRDTTGDESWRAPEWGRVRCIPAPEDDAYDWMAARRRDTAGDGIVVDEAMWDRRARRSSGVGLRLRLSIPGLDAFRADPEHPAAVTGSVRHSAIPGTHDVAGRVRLFPQSADHLMRYDLTFVDGTGRRWNGVGTKRLCGRRLIDRYRSLTRLELDFSLVDDPTVTIATELVMRPSDVIAMSRSIRGTGFTRTRRLQAIATFLGFFTYRALSAKGADGRLMTRVAG